MGSRNCITKKSPPIKTIKVLVVEDENLIAQDLLEQLALLGYTDVSTASSADQALAIADKSPPDLALLDIGIDGDMDGIDLGRELLNRYDVPIVYLTSYSDNETIDRAKQTGPYGYLIKPVNELELGSMLEIVLHKHKIEKNLRIIELKNRELERLELQREKMVAIANLTAGLAHQLNNSLMITMGNISLASLTSTTDYHNHLRQALEGCENSAELIRQLFKFAQHGPYHPEEADIQELSR